MQNRRELEELIQERICPSCVAYEASHGCGLETFSVQHEWGMTSLSECPVFRYLDRLEDFVEELGDSPAERYLEKIDMEVCPDCRLDLHKHDIIPPELCNCTLFYYLPLIVEIIKKA